MNPFFSEGRNACKTKENDVRTRVVAIANRSATAAALSIATLLSRRPFSTAGSFFGGRGADSKDENNTKFPEKSGKLLALTTHTPLIKGVDVHLLN